MVAAKKNAKAKEPITEESELPLESVQEVEVIEEKPPKNEVWVGTANGIYKLKKPLGKIGALHFRLLTKAMPNSSLTEDGKARMSPADQERLNEVFSQWSAEVLPFILKEFKYEEMPGEDQWFIFLAMFQTINVSNELFRIIE